jgi:peptidoglycan hydrolase-like protein with peptidoglycan-binding domain
MGISGINPSQLISAQPAIPATVGPGAAAKDVHPVQEQVKQLGYKIDAKEDQADTYGASTQAAVSQFQKDHQLPVTGVADGATQIAMAQAIRQRQELQQQAEREKLQAISQIQKGVSSFGP